MKKETKIYQFDPLIYPVKLWIVRNPIEQYIAENFKEEDGSELNFNIRNSYTMCCYNHVVVNSNTRDYGILIAIFKSTSLGNIAHESTHAARFIWDWIEEEFTGREADAYLVQWIAECIEKVKLGNV